MHQSTAPGSATARREVEVHAHNVTERSYPLHYYAAALPCLMRPHRYHDAPPARYRARLTLSPQQIADWHALYDLAPDAAIPFTYGNIPGAMLLLHLLNDTGISIRHLRHVSCRLELGTAAYAADVPLSVHMEPPPPILVRSDRIVVSTDLRVETAAGEPVARQLDRWMISRLRPADIAHLPADDVAAAPFRHLSRREAVLSEGKPLLVEIADDLAQRYAHVSGDLSPVHTSPLAVRAMGLKRPFVQGFCTINMMLAATHRLGLRPRMFEVTLVRPLFTGQQAAIRLADGQVECTDGSGGLVAAGCYS